MGIKMISWNVNGLRACMQKGFLDYFRSEDADIFCLQETKLQEGQLELDLPGYYQYWNFAEKKGYSGTALFTKKEPVRVTYGIGVEEHDHEGRVITAEFAEYYVVTVYVPNSQRELARLSYRMEWEAAFLKYIKGLEKNKPVIYCGDLNVAHEEIDLKNPRTNHNNAGFTDDERKCFRKVLESGYVDTFRYFYPDKKDIYSWWSYMFQARTKNAGWRIDYFVASEKLKDRLADAKIHTEVMGSDHCPVELELREDGTGAGGADAEQDAEGGMSSQEERKTEEQNVKHMTEPEEEGQKVQLIQYQKCSTCKKAVAWLKEHGISYEDRPIKEQNPTKEELAAWHKKSGLPLKRFFNTSGNLYKELQLKDKLPEMSEEEQLELLAADGMLVKRPLMVGEDFVLAGFKEKEWEEKLL